MTKMVTWHALVGLMTMCAVETLAVADVRAPPSITEPGFSKIVLFKDEANFSLACQASGTPPPRYAWLKDGQPVSSKYIDVDAETGVLSGDSFSRHVIGLYRCLANNTWGTSVSHVLDVQRRWSGTFDKTASRIQTLAEGDSASLKCKDSPSSNPVGTLHFAYVLPSDDLRSQEYACGYQANELISLGSKVRIHVTSMQSTPQTRPRLLSSTNNTLVFIGTTAVLECFFAGYPVPRIRWFRRVGGNPIADGSRHKLSRNGRRLQILNVMEGDEGDYFCQADNQLDQERHKMFLNVTSKPIWVKAPVSQTVVEGTDVTFQCTAKPARGEVQPSRPVWYRNWEELKQGLTYNESDLMVSIDGSWLLLKNVSRDRDISNIQCIIRNEFGPVFKDAYLNVLSPTVILSRPPAEVMINYGDVVSFAVSAVTDPSQNLTFRWKLNGQDIPSSQSGFTWNHDGSNLTIDTLSLTEQETNGILGRYMCLVSHDVQTVQVSVSLGIKGQTLETTTPGEVTQGAVVAQAQSSLWVLGLVLGLLLLVGLVALIVFLVKNHYPKRVYLLEKKELKSNLNPTRDLLNDSFMDL